jgi:hypothetical protein
MIKELSYIFCILTLSLSGFSQTSECANLLDTTEVIKIAKKKIPSLDFNREWTKNKYSISNIFFNEQSCEWKVYASKSKRTSKGKCEFSRRDCKEKPECTVTSSITLIIDANTKIIKKKSKVKHKKHNLQFVDDTPIHIIERELPVPKIYTLVYILEIYELINDSTLSEKPINMSVIYKDKDTLFLKDYLSKLSWDNTGTCESQDISYIPSVYYYSSRIDPNGLFSKFKIIRSGNSIECTESFMKLINKSTSDIKTFNAQYLNKNVCFRLKVRIRE